MIRIYLSGGIQGLSDVECKVWRENLKEKYTNTWLPNIKFLDPLRRDYRKHDKSGNNDDFTMGLQKEIVEYDKIDIQSADALIISHPFSSTGTDMETLYAWERGKLNVGVVPDGVVSSPWFTYHTHKIVSDYEEAVEFILRYFQ